VTGFIQRSLLMVIFATAIGFGQGSGENCSFRVDPNEYLTRVVREQRAVAERAGKFARQEAVAAEEIPRRNFIDNEIFDRLAKEGVGAARISSDEEFLRRITLDLTGRIPSAPDVRQFVADTSEDKRRAVIDRLLYSPEFTDKWTMWMGDLLGNVVSTTNVNRQIQGRNAFHDWIRGAVGSEKNLKQITWDALTAAGNNYESADGAVNYLLAGRQSMGPVQDWYDLMLYQAADRFLGMSHYDCLLCHDGRRHLDDISLWGKSQIRLDAQRMAAFFSRVNIAAFRDNTSPYFNSLTLSDRERGNYALGTTFGNRPNRSFVGTIRALDPEYRDGSKPGGQDWRSEFAAYVTADPLFAVNFANRLWKALFNYGLVEPVNALDPARLDPDNPPPAPWTLQPSHPRLLQLLAADLREKDFNLREFVRLLVESSAYQLSTRYDDSWNISQIPLFARHYPRRLEGEEVHDAIAKATNVFPNYTVGGWGDTVRWAMQLPDPQEPRSDRTGLNFMSTFLRGNRDTMQRSQSGSILQQLGLMNDAFVLNRNKVAASTALRAIAQITNQEALLEELYLTFLGRKPTEYERSQALPFLARATTQAARNTAVEDLAWVVMNKVEFVFSY
jgi:hypothetical protein